jgi:nucleoside-diphosphate-sugar epimerase
MKNTHKMSDPPTLQSHNLQTDSPVLCSASGGKLANFVSPNDIALAAVGVLTDPKSHKRVGYTLIDPNPITDLEVAELLGKNLNKIVDYREVTPEEKKTEGDPDWLDADLDRLKAIKATGLEIKFHLQGL